MPGRCRGFNECASPFTRDIHARSIHINAIHARSICTKGIYTKSIYIKGIGKDDKGAINSIKDKRATRSCKIQYGIIITPFQLFWMGLYLPM
jgi:hypothetical protein